MLVIRASQMAVFENLATARFQQSLLDHLRIFFPQHAAVLGDAQLVRVVRYGLQRAESRGLLSERALFLYTALMFMLGSHFDDDLQLPWAHWPAEPTQETTAPVQPAVAMANAAADESGDEQTAAAPPETADARVERIYVQAMEFLDRAIGPENQWLQQTLNAFQRAETFDEVPDAPSFGHRMLLLLQILAPEKYRALGAESLHDLVRHGYQSAKRYGLSDEHGLMNYIALAFILGSGFDRDPLYPWAAAVLSSPAAVDPARKGAALRTAALDALARILPACPRRAEQSAIALAQSTEPYQRIIEG